MGSFWLYMDGVILVVGCIWMESFWLYMDGVILVVYGWSHFESFWCIWMESFWLYMDGHFGCIRME